MKACKKMNLKIDASWRRKNMFNITRITTIAILLLCVATSSYATVINGGFEAGNTSPWITTGTAGVVTPGLDIRTNNNLNMVYNGTYSAMIGDQFAWGFGGPEFSSISQTETVTAGDNTDLYFYYAVVALVPTNGGHPLSDTPYFQADVMLNGSTSLYHLFTYTGNPGSIEPGWVQGVNDPNSTYGSNSPGTWYYYAWTEVHINLVDSNIQIGDSLTFSLITRDCDQSGHAAYAYVDGFGVTSVPGSQVPEPTSLLLLGTGLAGISLAAWRKRK
jgi:hypothetical protein